jgi:hypothetical protein
LTDLLIVICSVAVTDIYQLMYARFNFQRGKSIVIVLMIRKKRKNRSQKFSVDYHFCLWPSALLAGPLTTFPEGEKREPCHGQSNEFSELFHVTVQPK